MGWGKWQLRHAEGVKGEGKQSSQPQLPWRHEEPYRNCGRNARFPQLVRQAEPTRPGDSGNLQHRRLQDGQTHCG